MSVCYYRGDADRQAHKFCSGIIAQEVQVIGGLQSTLTLHKSKKIPAKIAPRFLQIIHCRGCHWIVASTVGSYLKVVLYGSLYTSLLKQMLGSKVIVELGSGLKQDSTADCGLFAIATCVSLATGSQPKDFIQRSMRDHLLLCIEKFTLSIFP